MLTATVALLVAVSAPVQTGARLPDWGSVRLLQADSAHTLFTPNAPDAGRSGQIYQLPQGGFGVTTGGTSNYQTLGTTNGSDIAVPNGSNSFDVIGSGGRAGTGHIRG